MTTLAQEQYSGGYSPLIIDQFKQRGLAQQGAFLRPYLEPGQTVLDCGCGPGSLSLDIAELVRPGRVYGLDRSDTQIGQALALQRQRGVENAEFRTGSAYELPYPDGRFDVVFAHAVLYHLRSPEKALAEFHRVLKPGGLVALRDACHAGDMMMPWSDGLAAVWAVIRRVFEHQGGNIDFGAEHKRVLLNQGFRDIELSFSYDRFASDAEKESIRAYWCRFLAEDHRDLILAQGWADAGELAGMATALNRWCADPAGFFARARCEAVART